MAALREALRILARASAPRQGEMNALRMFAGPMAKTADHQALARAQEMAGQGATRDTIWRDTGWFQGVDGKWRFEIDDSGATFRTPASGPDGFEGTVGDLLDHPSLYEAYPGMRTVHGSYDLMPGESGAWGILQDGRESMAVGPVNARSTALHEGQHGIQRREGMARGGSTRSRSTLDNARTMQDDAGRRFEALLSEMRAFQDDALARAGADADETRVRQMASREWRAQNPDKAQMMDEAWNVSTSMAPPRYQAYERLAGEVEARNVQTRRDFTPEQRRSRPPWETQDVPDDQQIIRFDGDRASNALGDMLRVSAGLGGVALAGDITLRELLRERRANRANPSA